MRAPFATPVAASRQGPASSMTALQLQLLIAVARTVRDMASNPLASVGTARLSEALAAVEERYGEPEPAHQTGRNP